MKGMDVEALRDLQQRELPVATLFGLHVDSMGEGRAIVRLPWRAEVVRPGATVAGPGMMAAADLAMYAALLSLDDSAVSAVTSDFTIHFLHPPRERDVLAEGQVIRMGRRLIYLEVMLNSEGDPDPVAHATGTYTRRNAPSSPVVK